MQRELKVFQQSDAIGYGDFVLSLVGAITQGAAGSQRLTDKIRVKKIQIRYTLDYGAAGDTGYSATIRPLVLIDQRGLFSDATFFNQVYNTAVSGVTPLEQFNVSNLQRFTILHDSFHILEQKAQYSLYEPIWRYIPTITPFQFARVLTFDNLDCLVSFPTAGSAINNIVFMMTQFDPVFQLSGVYYSTCVYFEDVD